MKINIHVTYSWYEDFFKRFNSELWEKVVSPEWTN